MEEIQKLEERIRQAQLSNDVEALDQLLAPDLQFVFLDGSVVGKAEDLEAHRKKLVRFEAIDFTEQVIRSFGDVATVTVKAEIKASVGGKPIHQFCRYGRTWAKLNGRWKLIAGNVVQLAGKGV